MPEDMHVTQLEHYKRVCCMLDLLVRRTDDTFRFFVQISTAVVGGFIWVKMQGDASKVAHLLEGARFIIPALACAAVAEIVNCLYRWYGYRQAECSLNPKAPAPNLVRAAHGELVRILVIFAVGISSYYWLR